MRSRRTAVAAVVGVGLAITAVGAAQGAQPERSPVPSSGFSFPAGMVCSFAVDAEVATNRQFSLTFSSGKVATHGFFEGTLLANGNELSVVQPGSMVITPADNDLINVTLNGPIVVFFFPGDAGPGDTSTGRTYLLKGHAELLVDPETFEFLEFEHSGAAEDLCAALA